MQSINNGVRYEVWELNMFTGRRKIHCILLNRSDAIKRKLVLEGAISSSLFTIKESLCTLSLKN